MVLKLSEKWHYKELDPVVTVEKLKKILDNYGVMLEEKWMEKSSVDTYSLRLVIKGTGIGTNGKGITRELARASAYAEFFERFQNRALDSFRLKDEVDYFVARDEIVQNAKELFNNESTFLKEYMKELGLGGNSINNKIKYFSALEIRDQLEYGLKGRYVTLPFFNVKKKMIEYLPYSICKLVYSSNGMCAGNSREEALVQGISEIIERYVQKKLLIEKPVLPDIPESYLKKYTYIYERFLKMREIKGYQVYFKDCSFGGRYPVAALIIVEDDTGNYGVKLGCHPNYGIAMERMITEITQGQEITDFCKLSRLDFANKGVEGAKNIVNSFKAGIAQYPYQLLGREPSFEFKEITYTEDLDNVQLLHNYLKSFSENGYTVYIRDESKLGFPSYQIIIPGISEVMVPTVDTIKAYNTRLYLNKFLANPELIREKECRCFIATMKFFNGLVLEDSISSRYSERYDCCKLPGAELESSNEYFLLLCFVYLQQYDEAAGMCGRILENITKFFSGDLQLKYHRGLYHYLIAMDNLKDHSETMKYLNIYFSNDICKKIDDLYNNPKQVFKKIYPSLEQLPEKYSKNDENIRNVNKMYGEMCHIIINQNQLAEIMF